VAERHPVQAGLPQALPHADRIVVNQAPRQKGGVCVRLSFVGEGILFTL
jgi:hypothetical protein